MNNITPIKPVELGKPETHLMQSRLTKGVEGVKPASHVLYEVLTLVEELGSDELKREVEKIKGI